MMQPFFFANSLSAFLVLHFIIIRKGFYGRSGLLAPIITSGLRGPARATGASSIGSASRTIYNAAIRGWPVGSPFALFLGQRSRCSTFRLLPFVQSNLKLEHQFENFKQTRRCDKGCHSGGTLLQNRTERTKAKKA